MISGVLGGFEEEWSYGEARAITFIGQTVPIGVGKIVCNKQDVAKRKGVALVIINLYKDYLWAMGSKYNPQFKKYVEVEEEEEVEGGEEEKKEGETNEEKKEGEGEGCEEKKEGETNEEKEGETAETKENEAEKTENTEAKEGEVESQGESKPSTEATEVKEEETPKTEEAKEEESGEKEKKEEENEDEDEEEAKTPTQEMDELIILSFLRALKTRVTKDQYPILASTFYFAHVLPSRPPGTSLNIKKSSYKKLSNLLEWAVEENIIETSIDKAGVIKITAVNKDHPLIKSVNTAQALKDRKSMNRTSEGSNDNNEDYDDEDESDGSGMMNPLVTELYNVPKPLIPYFEGILEDGKTSVTRQEVSKAVAEYIRKEELDMPACVGNQRSCALVDDKLASALGKRFAETESRLVPKKDICEMFLAKLQPFYILNRDDIPSNERIRKGKIVPIMIEVEKSVGSKKVTVISNLESFYIDQNTFAKNLQKLIASAATVQNDGKVLALGDCTQKASTFLIRQHRVPKKYITIVKPKQHKKKK